MVDFRRFINVNRSCKLSKFNTINTNTFLFMVKFTFLQQERYVINGSKFL